ncbi:MAG: hypothetical protein IKC11_02080 [Clostridia bacterium]|nr:hypothetical protein [Clostridia bacterium]
MRFVLKFGGSSLSSATKIKNIASYIKNIKGRKDVELVIVVSAMGKTTNKLIKLAGELSPNPYSTNYSSLISCGENISASALALALEEENIPSISLTAKDIKIYAKGKATNALITHIDTHKIEHHLSCGKVVIITGFQGINENEELLTLGRGGSDTTATALGSVLNATVKIFTDVRGYYTFDPNTHSNAKQIKSLPITSALILSSFGAKVLDHRSLEIVNKYKTDISVCKSLTNQGTIINYSNLESFHTDGISLKQNISFVKYTYKKDDFLQHIKENCSFKTYFCSYETTNQSTTCCFLSDITPKELSALIVKKSHKFECFYCDCAVIAGSGLTFYPEVIKKVQNILKINHIKYFFINLSPTDIKICTKQKQGSRLVQLLMKEFNLEEKEEQK